MIGSIINAISQQATNYSQKQLAREQMAWQQQENERVFNRNLQMWDMQNQYNSPAAQRERIEAAGGNAMLAFGNGINVTSGNASEPPQLDAAKSIQPDLKAYTGWNLGMNSIQDLIHKERLIDSQVAASEATSRKTDAEAIAIAFQNGLNEEARDAILSRILSDSEYSDYNAKSKKQEYLFNNSVLDFRKNILEKQSKMSEKELKIIEQNLIKLTRENEIGEATKEINKIVGTNGSLWMMLSQFLGSFWNFLPDEAKDWVEQKANEIQYYKPFD